MGIEELKKYFKYMVLILGVLLLINRGWAFFKHKDSEKSGNDLASVYHAYTLSGMKAAKEKIHHYAEILYNKDVAAGKTDKKFRGFTKIGYCSDAISEYKEEITEIDELAYYLPLFFIILVVFALIVSISFCLKAIRPLDFEDKVTSFKS